MADVAQSFGRRLQAMGGVLLGGMLLPALASFMLVSGGGFPQEINGELYMLYLPAFAGYALILRRLSGVWRGAFWQRALLLAWLYMAVCGVWAVCWLMMAVCGVWAVCWLMMAV